MYLLFALPVFGTETVNEYTQENESRVMSYLLSLTNDDIDQKSLGIELSDGKKYLENNIFLGKISDKSKGSYIYIFNTSNYGNIALIWINKRGEKIELPQCLGDDARINWPGWGGSVISGDVYTYTHVYPGADLVITHCVPVYWLEQSAPIKPLKSAFKTLP